MTIKEFQKEWSKETTRIRRAIRRLEARGYTVDFTIPERPKGIAPRKLAELRSETTHAKLISRSTYITEDGKIITGFQAQTIRRRESAKKGQETRKRKKRKSSQQRYKEWEQEREREQWKEKTLPRYSTIVLENLRRQLASWSRGKQSSFSSIRNPVWKQTIGSRIELSSTLLNLLESKIANEGERRVALRLENQASEINEALEMFLMSSRQEDVQDASVRIATVINGGSLSSDLSEELTAEGDYEFSS